MAIIVAHGPPRDKQPRTNLGKPRRTCVDGQMTLTPPMAVIADIHGNSLALRAVLDHIDRAGITQIINLGDHFSGPLDAAETWAALRDRPEMLSVRGDHDRYLIELDPDDMWPSDRIAHDALGPDALAWLKSLPFERRIGDIYMCHATPENDNLYWSEEVISGTTRLAPLSVIEQRAKGLRAGLILYAHTHLPRVLRLGDGRLMVNPGSVGCPAYTDTAPAPHVVQTGTPMASYAVIHTGPDAQGAPYRVTHHAVPYDHDAAAAQARAYDRLDWVRAVSTGWL